MSFDPERERALLAAFDAAWTKPRVVISRRAWPPLAAAAVLILAAGVAWTIANRRVDVHAPNAPQKIAAAPQVVASAARPEPVEETAPPPAARAVPTRVKPAHGASAPVNTDAASAFVPWPGAETLPAFESGHLMRLDHARASGDLARSQDDGAQAGVVRADILVGQDGLARAVRVAP